MKITSEEIRKNLKQIWGYENFRPPQEEIVNSLLSQKDALIIMPTGAGKSICFQLPALLNNGLTLVVSPLIALMENQVEELKQRNQKADLLHSELPTHQRHRVLESITKQQLRLLYLSPETLLSSAVWEKISHPHILIRSLILDEAHCLVQWGETFRPVYRRLAAVRPALLNTKPPGTKITVAAFTATADPTTQNIIRDVLQLQQPDIYQLNPYRQNLKLTIKTVWTPRARKQQLLKFLQLHPHQTGLIYVRTRKDSEELAKWLIDLGYDTASYHAGLGGDERRAIEKSWLHGKKTFVVCTCAFGMGINKADVRWIVHFHAPYLLSEYVQEIGRAGRDGILAEVLTFISEPTGFLDGEDQRRQQFFQQQILQQYQKAQELIKKLPLQGEVKSVLKEFQHGAIALSLLHSKGNLVWIDPFHYQILDKEIKQGEINFKAARQMVEYLRTKNCRWQFLLGSFGFNKGGENWRCGHCDNCK
ncbi:RecQ family ATP-dependent DNA helicase [Cylindrospermopsis curvispora]|uniref:ATP-dependent DNA helicase RecQ n=1 Tax=Cylindrospermopsis curvispora GIHE-G1 TaxID=2666332 RepID=A0A7H0EWL2_9CYAN|nr:ATP-dependent DNA helicase RecQ [Cylindrospermopsis curvispora]QNP28178.1 ATP-dependent DNA helicase RecQ [Cylindrospermopsis curvispora GIHE-G1]